MAIQNYYVNPLIVGNVVTKSLRAFQSNGAYAGCLLAVVNVLSTDNNTSVYRLFKNLNKEMTITDIVVANQALTTGTSYGIGLYYPDLSLTTATTIGYFSGVMNLVTPHASITAGTALDGFAGMTPGTTGIGGAGTTVLTNRLFEHAGFTQTSTPASPPCFDMCLTATTASTVSGQVLVSVDYIFD